MKKVTQVIEVEGEGLEALLDSEVVLFCANYIYAGKLTRVNATCVQLENASVVYETGDFSAASFKDAQKLYAKYWYVQTNAIESFGARK